MWGGQDSLPDLRPNEEAGTDSMINSGRVPVGWSSILRRCGSPKRGGITHRESGLYSVFPFQGTRPLVQFPSLEVGREPNRGETGEGIPSLRF